MQRWLWILLGIAFIILLGVPRYLQSVYALRPGDTVVPVWSGPSRWHAGDTVSFATRLQAIDIEGHSRHLGFDGIPYHANPVATIQFYHGDDYLDEPIEVVLSHRC